MTIELISAQPRLIRASSLQYGEYAIKKGGSRVESDELIVVRSWGGLMALDGLYFWANESLDNIMVERLAIGTVLRLTI